MARKSYPRIQDIGRIVCAYPADVNKHMAPYLEISGSDKFRGLTKLPSTTRFFGVSNESDLAGEEAGDVLKVRPERASLNFEAVCILCYVACRIQSKQDGSPELIPG